MCGTTELSLSDRVKHFRHDQRVKHFRHVFLPAPMPVKHANSCISMVYFAVTDVAGVVAGVGPGVNDLAVGDQVVAMLNSMVSSFHSCVMFIGLPFQLNNIMPQKKT